MEVLLFDTSPLRRKFWKNMCRRFAVEFKCFDSLIDLSGVENTEARIIVFDDSAMNDWRSDKAKFIAALPYDAVSFIVSTGAILEAIGLMRCGAMWVFDSGVGDDEWEAGFTTLLKDAEALTVHAREFRSIQAMYATTTSGERAVLEFLITGLSLIAIKKCLGIGTRTLFARKYRAFQKCGVANIAELVFFMAKKERLEKQFSVARSPMLICSCESSSDIDTRLDRRYPSNPNFS